MKKEVSFANDNIDTMMKPDACDIVFFDKDDPPSDLWKIRNEKEAVDLVETLIHPVHSLPLTAWRPKRFRVTTPIDIPKKIEIVELLYINL